jgi:cytochrome P450
MAVRTHEFRRYAEVVAALADPALAPVPPTESAQAAPGEDVGTAAWLRAHVARFDHGPRHARRRAAIEAALARIDPAALREAVAANRHRADPRAQAALALAVALGPAEPERVTADVGLASAVYFGGDDPAADAAVARLVDAFAAARGSTDSEEIANLISILIQAYDSTGSLVEHAAAHLDDETADIDAVVLETLLNDPPLLAMRRVALRDTSVAGAEIGEGDLVTLDIASANRDPAASAPGLTFGSEPRRCPGSAHAVALAAGILAS